MKRLLVIPLIFAVVACAPVKEKIEDRTGGCVNGKCVNKPSEKPSVCSGAAKFSALAGTFKTDAETSATSGVTYRAQFIFNGNKASLTQFCDKKKSGEFESPVVESTFSVNSDVSALKFDDPQVMEKKSESFTCKAEITAEVFAISAQGSCLVLKPKKGDALYYVKQGN